MAYPVYTSIREVIGDKLPFARTAAGTHKKRNTSRAVEVIGV